MNRNLLINYDEVRELFNKEFKETMQLIQDGETHLDNLAEGFTEADRVLFKLLFLKPQTNADRIRAMSDEELAWITVREIKVWNYVEGCYDAEYKCSDGYVTDDYRAAIDHEVAWLKQPVKDGEGE